MRRAAPGHSLQLMLYSSFLCVDRGLGVVLRLAATLCSLLCCLQLRGARLAPRLQRLLLHSSFACRQQLLGRQQPQMNCRRYDKMLSKAWAMSKCMMKMKQAGSLCHAAASACSARAKGCAPHACMLHNLYMAAFCTKLQAASAKPQQQARTSRSSSNAA